MDQNTIMHSDLFEPTVSYPDIEMRERLSRLIGIDGQKQTLAKILGLLIDPRGLEVWIEAYHPGAKYITDVVLRRPPLVILSGDVGSGKSELAYTICDSVARDTGIDITLLPLSLATRGIGRVGQMTQLISAAFSHTIELAKKLKAANGKSKGAVVLMVDEADALAQTRESSQMHHEDKAGVNAFIRGIDSIGHGKFPAAVLMCTNRIGSLDPALKRRAAEILSFKRPNEHERQQVLLNPLSELGLSEECISKIVTLTGIKGGREYGATFSDLTQRLLPSIALTAYPHTKVTQKIALEVAEQFVPTPPFKEQ